MNIDRPLWTCPRCGARFVTANMWHGCGDYSVDRFLEGKGPRARALFDRLLEVIGTCGPFDIVPTKSRVAFMVRVRFAGVNAISEKGMTVNFGLPYPLEHPRIARTTYISSGWYGHRFRAATPDDLDDEVRGWLCESYRLMGRQDRFQQA